MLLQPGAFVWVLELVKTPVNTKRQGVSHIVEKAMVSDYGNYRFIVNFQQLHTCNMLELDIIQINRMLRLYMHSLM